MPFFGGFQRDVAGNISISTASSGVASSQASMNVAVPAGTTAQVISAVPGRVFYVLATSAGTNVTPGTLSDGSTIIAVIPATAALGTLISLNIPFGQNLTYSCAAGGPALTIGVS